MLLAEASTSASAVADRSSTSWRRAHNTVLSECGVTSVCKHRRPCLRIISCLREMANWSCPLAIPPGVCWTSPIHTTPCFHCVPNPLMSRWWKGPAKLLWSGRVLPRSAIATDHFYMLDYYLPQLQPWDKGSLHELSTMAAHDLK